MTRRVALNDPNLLPVQITRLENPGGVVEGFEVGFTEYAPERRNKGVYALWVAFTMVTFVPFLLLLEPVTTLLWIGFWVEGSLTQEQKNIAYWVLGGSALFPLGVWNLWPPFKMKTAVVMRPGSDWLEIWRGGKCTQTARLSEVRGASVEPHPALADCIGRMERNPHDKGARWRANVYRQAENIYLMIGPGITISKIEVASIMAKRFSREMLTMKIRGALDLAWRAAMATREDMARMPSPPPPVASPPPKQRRRRGRIE